MLSTVKSIQGNGTFTSPHGAPLGDGTTGFFKFEYQMEDGAIVNANHKTAQSPFKVGDQVEYEITNHDHNNGKVKKPQTPPQANGTTHTPNQPQPQVNVNDSILYQVCLKGVMDFYVANATAWSPSNINAEALELARQAKLNIQSM